MKRRRFCFLLFLLLILTSCRMQAFRPTDLERSTVNLTQGSIEGRIMETWLVRNRELTKF